MKTDNHTKLAAVAAVLVGLFAVVAVNKYIEKRTKVAPPQMASILVAKMEITEGALAVFCISQDCSTRFCSPRTFLSAAPTCFCANCEA